MKNIIIASLTLVLLACNSKVNSGQPEKNIDLEDYYQKNLETNNLNTGIYYLGEDSNSFVRYYNNTYDGRTDTFYINPRPIAVAANYENIELKKNNQNDFYYIHIKLDKEGTYAFSEATESAIGSQLIFIVDNKIVSIPRVMNRIELGNCVISGHTKEECQQLIDEIEKEISKTE